MSTPLSAPPAAWADIDLTAIQHNLRAIRQQLPPGTQIAAVLKANAYGHGALPIAKALSSGDPDTRADWFCAATLDEALAIQAHVPGMPILTLTALCPDQFAEAIQAGIEFPIESVDSIRAVQTLAAKTGKIARVHLKLDTGMSRLGAQDSQIPAMLSEWQSCPQVEMAGIYTHFASADCDLDETRAQWQRFERMLKQARAAGFTHALAHAANSAAILRHPESHAQAVRPGLLIYGIAPTPEMAEAPLMKSFKPALSLKSRIVSLRDVPAGAGVSYGALYRASRPLRVATLGIGYADGYPRRLSNQGEVLARGRRAPVLGKICMDMIMVDVSAIPGVSVGETVTLIGSEGSEQIRVESLAAMIDTTPHEITTCLGSRLPRLCP